MRVFLRNESLLVHLRLNNKKVQKESRIKKLDKQAQTPVKSSFFTLKYFWLNPLFNKFLTLSSLFNGLTVYIKYFIIFRLEKIVFKEEVRMKIAIAGAGAMGSRFGLMLHQGGNDVLLIDGWMEHVQQIKAHGLKANFNGEEIVATLPIVHQKEIDQEDKVDLIILFTKAMQLEKMLQDIQGLIKKETEVLCLLNGIGHEDIIEKFVPKDQIYIGNTMWTAGLEGPGQVKLFGDGSVELQNLGAGKEAAAKELAKQLAESGLNAHFSENIHYSIYRKACVNGTMNGLCTILDVNMAELGKTATAHKMVEKIVKEFAKVAAAENISLDCAEVIAHCETCFDPGTIGLHYPSMHQDLIKNHRLTEIDYINGAISRKGRKYGIETPYCDFLTELIHAKEDSLQVK